MIKFSLFLCTILIVISIFILIHFNVLTIKAVDVKLGKIACTNTSQIRDSSNLLGQNLIFLNSANVEESLKKKYICIRSVTLSRNFPDKVSLEVFGREPAAILVVLKSEEASGSAILEKFSEATDSANLNFSNEGIGESFMVDNEGVLYSTNTEQLNAPKVFVSGLNLALGQKIKGDITFNTLKILDKIKSFGIDSKDAKIYSPDLLLVSAIPKMIFKLSSQIDIQLASLQLILSQAKIDDAKLEFIDLRFDKPIVRFAPKI